MQAPIDEIQDSLLKKINVFIFVFILIILGVLFWILPKEKISVNEKRKLTPLPRFSLENLFNQKYTDSIDLFYSDNFLFRNKLIDASIFIKKIRGYNKSEIKIYNTAKPNASNSKKILPTVKMRKFRLTSLMKISIR
jgi:hypothetical protein